MSLHKLIAPLARRISNIFARGSVTLVNAAGKLQTLQISLLNDESKDSVEHFEPYGFTSNPHIGAEIISAFIEGDRSHGIVLAAADRRYRLQNLATGEVAIYDDHGSYIALTQSGIVINGGVHPITINNATTVNVTNGDVFADSISLKNHHHTEHDGPPTSSAQA